MGNFVYLCVSYSIPCSLSSAVGSSCWTVVGPRCAQIVLYPLPDGRGNCWDDFLPETPDDSLSDTPNVLSHLYPPIHVSVLDDVGYQL